MKRFAGLRMLPAGGLIPLLVLVCVIVHVAALSLLHSFI